MPGKQYSVDEIIDKAAAVPMYSIAGLVYAACYMLKYVWRFLVFTGLWPLAALIAIFAITGSMDHLTWPAFFSIASRLASNRSASLRRPNQKASNARSYSELAWFARLFPLAMEVSRHCSAFS